MSIQEIKKKINPILKKNGVKRAAIFGSYARGEEKKRSDVDILIEYKNDDKSLLDLVGLEMELKKKLRKKGRLVTLFYGKPSKSLEFANSKKINNVK